MIIVKKQVDAFIVCDVTFKDIVVPDDASDSIVDDDVVKQVDALDLMNPIDSEVYVTIGLYKEDMIEAKTIIGKVVNTGNVYSTIIADFTELPSGEYKAKINDKIYLLRVAGDDRVAVDQYDIKVQEFDQM